MYNFIQDHIVPQTFVDLENCFIIVRSFSATTVHGLIDLKKLYPKFKNSKMVNHRIKSTTGLPLQNGTD